MASALALENDLIHPVFKNTVPSCGPLRSENVPFCFNMAAHKVQAFREVNYIIGCFRYFSPIFPFKCETWPRAISPLSISFHEKSWVIAQIHFLTQMTGTPPSSQPPPSSETLKTRLLTSKTTQRRVRRGSGFCSDPRPRPERCMLGGKWPPNPCQTFEKTPPLGWQVSRERLRLRSQTEAGERMIKKKRYLAFRDKNSLQESSNTSL